MEFLEEVASKEIDNKIFTRDGGGIQDTGAPFFIEEIHRKRMIRSNHTQNLRMSRNERFKSNCQPSKTNYLADRM